MAVYITKDVYFDTFKGIKIETWQVIYSYTTWKYLETIH